MKRNGPRSGRGRGGACWVIAKVVVHQIEHGMISGMMKGGDVGWTFVKVSEQDAPKLLWHAHVGTSLPSCDITTPTCKHNMACAEHAHRLVPSAVLLSTSLAHHGDVLSAIALSSNSEEGGFVVVDVVFHRWPTWHANRNGGVAWVLMWQNHMAWTQKSQGMHARQE
jgi:hypothetical protein